MEGIRSKVTSKLQVTIPKVLADQYGLVPGDEIAWRAAGPEIRLIPPRAPELSLEERLKLFDAVLKRQRSREKARGTVEVAADRGWTREELYGRGGIG